MTWPGPVMWTRKSPSAPKRLFLIPLCILASYLTVGSIMTKQPVSTTSRCPSARSKSGQSPPTCSHIVPVPLPNLRLHRADPTRSRSPASSEPSRARARARGGAARRAPAPARRGRRASPRPRTRHAPVRSSATRRACGEAPRHADRGRAEPAREAVSCASTQAPRRGRARRARRTRARADDAWGDATLAALPASSRGVRSRAPLADEAASDRRKEVLGNVVPYEILLMLDPDLAEERASEIVARTRELVEKGGGTWSNQEPWGRRKLAYEIDHKGEGAYHLLTFTTEPETLN